MHVSQRSSLSSITQSKIASAVDVLITMYVKIQCSSVARSFTVSARLGAIGLPDVAALGGKQQHLLRDFQELVHERNAECSCLLV